jgi:hypothetical protein
LEFVEWNITIQPNRTPMHFIHVISRGYVSICLPQKISLKRIALQIDAQPTVPFVDMSEAFLAPAMADDTPVIIVKGVILISA